MCLPAHMLRQSEGMCAWRSPGDCQIVGQSKTVSGDLVEEGEEERALPE
jgi:hypothetical protein